MKKYYIEQIQYSNLSHFQDIFEYSVEKLDVLCKEQRDERILGFELGKLVSLLRNNHTDIVELLSQIKNQELSED